MTFELTCPCCLTRINTAQVSFSLLLNQITILIVQSFVSTLSLKAFTTNLAYWQYYYYRTVHRLLTMMLNHLSAFNFCHCDLGNIMVFHLVNCVTKAKQQDQSHSQVKSFIKNITLLVYYIFTIAMTKIQST